MIEGRRTAMLAAFAVAASVYLLPASPASAATFPNACINSVTANNSQIDADMTATASPNPVSPGGPVTLSNIRQSLAVPGAIFLAGLPDLPLRDGSAHGARRHKDGDRGHEHGRGDADHEQGLRLDLNGDQRSDPRQPQQRRRVGNSGPVGRHLCRPDLDRRGERNDQFPREHSDPLSQGPPSSGGIVINALVGGAIPVEFDCSPGTVSGPDPGVVTFTDPAVSLASTQIVHPQCKKLEKQLKKAKKAHNKAEVKKIRKKIRKLGC